MEKSSEVTFKYYLPENDEDVLLHINARKLYQCLYDIDQVCRKIIKYGDDGILIEGLAESIRDIIHNNVNMDMVS